MNRAYPGRTALRALFRHAPPTGSKAEFGGSAAALTERLENRVRIDPNVTRSLLFIYLMQSELDLLRLRRVGEQGLALRSEDPRRLDAPGDGSGMLDMDRDAVFAGIKAYVAHAHGRRGEGRCASGRRACRYRRLCRPRPRGWGDRKPKPKREITAEMDRDCEAKGDELHSLVNEWESAGKLRAEIASHTMEQMLDVVNEFKNKRAETFPAVIDLLREYGKGGDTEEAKTAAKLVANLVGNMLEDQRQARSGRVRRKMAAAG